jgi:hypothetical protein
VKKNPALRSAGFLRSCAWNYMPDEDDLAGAEVSPVAAFLCAFLWVDFIVPSDFMSLSDFIVPDEVADVSEVPDFIESLLVCVGVAVFSALGASCAKAAPPITVQPASIARISFVLRMT